MPDALLAVKLARAYSWINFFTTQPLRKRKLSRTFPSTSYLL